MEKKDKYKQILKELKKLLKDRVKFWKKSLTKSEEYASGWTVGYDKGMIRAFTSCLNLINKLETKKDGN